MRLDLDFEKYRNILENERAALAKNIEQEANSLSTNPEANPDVLDDANKTATQSRRIGWINQMKGRKHQIEEALQRLESGRFGVCDRCGKDIDLDRLDKKPYARYCLQCQKNMEKKYD